MTTTYQTQSCSSNLQFVWILSVYLFNAAILCAGFYLTWSTRKVTIPALKDSRQIYVTVYTVTVMALTVMPVLLVADPSPVVKYSVGALAIWFTLVVTATMLFVPKVRVEKKYKCK